MVHHSADITQLILSHNAFLCLYFDSILILRNIFVELEHFILFNNFDKYHAQLHFLQDKHTINGS